MLARLMSGTNNLRIETGRYNGRKIEERICKLCNEGIEDEHHFLNIYNMYENIRNECKKKFNIENNNNEMEKIMFGN